MGFCWLIGQVPPLRLLDCSPSDESGELYTADKIRGLTISAISSKFAMVENFDSVHWGVRGVTKGSERLALSYSDAGIA